MRHDRAADTIQIAGGFMPALSAALLDAIRANAEELARFVESLPPDAFGGAGANDEWSLAEVCGHASEFPVYHARTLRRIVDGEADVRFGRGSDDADRVAGIRRFGGAAPAEVAGAIRASAEEAIAILGALPADAWERSAQSVDGETCTIREAVRTRLSDHLRGHLNQARRAAGA
jgi:hypothetical protein